MTGKTGRGYRAATIFRAAVTPVAWFMSSSLRVRSRLCRLMVAVLLFAQLAVAAHACPVPVSYGEPRQMTADVAMPPCHTGEAPVAGAPSVEPSAADDAVGAVAVSGLPSLCFEHCHDGAQATDPHGAATATALGVPPAGGLFVVLNTSMAALQPVGLATGKRIAPGTSPPHTIAHCCLRV